MHVHTEPAAGTTPHPRPAPTILAHVQCEGAWGGGDWVPARRSWPANVSRRPPQGGARSLFFPSTAPPYFGARALSERIEGEANLVQAGGAGRRPACGLGGPRPLTLRAQRAQHVVEASPNFHAALLPQPRRAILPIPCLFLQPPQRLGVQHAGLSSSLTTNLPVSVPPLVPHTRQVGVRRPGLPAEPRRVWSGSGRLRGWASPSAAGPSPAPNHHAGRSGQCPGRGNRPARPFRGAGEPEQGHACASVTA